MTGRILIADSLATNRIILRVKLNAACYETVQATSGAEVLRLAREEPLRLILLDMALPDMDGVDIVRKLRADPRSASVPVILLTASYRRDLRLQALQAGADDCLVKPLNDVILLARLRAILRMRDVEAELRHRGESVSALDLAEGEAPFAAQPRVALVAGEPTMAIGWRMALSGHFNEGLSVISPTLALADMPQAKAPDCYLIAADLGPHGSGHRLVADLRARPASRYAVIIMVLDRADPEAAASALDMGASDLLPLPFDAEETALRITTHVARKRRGDQLRGAVTDGLRMAITDSLTGLFNRRYALAQLERISAAARDSGRDYAVMVLDLDRFKAVNDTFGHAAGDRVLEVVAERLRTNLRPSDMVARIGGEEFLAVLPDVTLPAARHAAERLCRVIAEDPIPLPGQARAITITVSVGLAMGPAAMGGALGLTPRDTLERADAALLGAKAEGRNQVTISSAA